MKKRHIVFIFLVLVLSYLYLGTGIHSDDYIHLRTVQNWEIEKLLTIDISNQPMHWFCVPIVYYDFIQFFIFKNNTLLYDVVKIITSLLCIYLIYLFAKDYMNPRKAVLFSGMFILFPLHDSTNYWVTGQYMIITAALVMYSHCMFHHNKIKKGLLVGFIASFASYASPPYVFGLSLIFLMRKQYKKTILFLLPQITYVIYLIAMRRILNLADYKSEGVESLSKFLKLFILQIGTFIDVAVGPSFWLKIWYSFMQLSIPSIFIGCFLVYIFFRYYEAINDRVDIKLVYSFIVTLFLAFGMYTLTGLYPQMAFNLGNRVTIYGSMLISLLIVGFLMNGRKSATIVFAIFVFSVLGISDHWKNWNTQQEEIIGNISKNRELANFDTANQLFVSYNQYSKFGKICHIEFFSGGDTAKGIFKFATGKDYNIQVINKRFEFGNGEIVDKKFGNRHKINKFIYVYDSKSNRLLKIQRSEIQGYIEKLPEDKRHWIQLLGKESFIKRIVLSLMPRLKYAL